VQSRQQARFEKVVIVTRMTQLEELLARFNTTAQARFYLQHAGEPFEPIEHAHSSYHRVLDYVRNIVPRGTKSLVIERQFLPQFHFDEHDLVITVGIDGLVVNTAKYLNNQPILAVNSAPQVIDGVLLPFTAVTAGRGLDNALYGDLQVKNISMAEAVLNDGQRLLAFNDLFIGAKSHVSARYEITSGKKNERHSSSGIIVSTGAGSTGWLQSVFAGAAGVVKALGGHIVPPPNHGRFDWEADELIFSVREPFPSKSSQAALVFGTITPDKPLILNSHMADNGVIFSDGVESDYVAFNSGTRATIRVADKKTRLIVNTG
jgi:NAD kinase